MTSKQSSIYSMLKRVILFLKKFEEFFLTLQVMAGLLTELESNLSKIDILREQQATDITGLRYKKRLSGKPPCKKRLKSAMQFCCMPALPATRCWRMKCTIRKRI